MDRTLLRENLKLTVEERFAKFERFWQFAQESREAGRTARQTESGHGAELPRDPAGPHPEGRPLHRHRGGAALAHGAARLTYDVDVVYARDPENLRRLATALQPFQLYLRGAPPGLPFRRDDRTDRGGVRRPEPSALNSTLGGLERITLALRSSQG